MEIAYQNEPTSVVRGFLFPFLLLAAAVTTPAAATRTIALDEALRLAETSPALSALTLEVDRARAELSATGLRSNPEVSLSREEAAGTVDRFVNLLLSLPLTRRLSIEKEAARSGLEAAEAQTRLARMGLRLRVRELFVDLLAAQRRHEAVTMGLSDLSALVEILQTREAEGEASGFDRMRAERERAEVEAEWFDARARLARARESLAALLAIAASDLVADGSLEPSGELPAWDEVRTVLASRGDIVGLEAEARRADHLARAARRRAVPEPIFTVGAKTTEMDGASGTGAVAAIAFTVPLFDRGQGSLAVAHAEGALLRARREALVREAEGEALAAREEAEARRAAEQAYAAAGDSDDLIRIAGAAYEEGEMRILELLDAYRTALATRLRMIDLRADARRAELALNRALGTEVVR
jgi:cobalt-zinc-cadmium efflux system outer membrane protein